MKRNIKRTMVTLLAGTVVVGSAVSVFAKHPASIEAANVGRNPSATPAPTPIDQKVEKLKKDRDELRTQIETLATQGSCKVAKDCDMVPIGSKPCGGAWSYMAVAKNNPQLTSLKTKIKSYDQLDKRFNEAAQLMSDCSIVAQGRLACENRVCKVADEDPGDSP